MDINLEPRVLILGDHMLARAGLAALLAPREDLTVVGQAAIDDTLEQQLDVYRPDVVVWDLGYTPLVGLAAVPMLTEAEIPSVMLLGDEAPVRDVVDAMADYSGGYALLHTQTDAGQLAAAVQGVLHGLVIVAPVLWDDLLPDPATVPFTLGESFTASDGLILHDDLTPREMQVLQLLAQGLPNKIIARELEISPNTVKFHVNAILSKLDAQSRTEAVVRATQLGLILL